MVEGIAFSGHVHPRTWVGGGARRLLDIFGGKPEMFKKLWEGPE